MITMRPARRQPARRRIAGAASFSPHDDAVALPLHLPARDGVERRRPQRLAGAQAEAGVVPGAAHRVADDSPSAERTAVVRARGADGEDLLAAPRQQHRLLSHLAGQHAALRAPARRAPCCSVMSATRRCCWRDAARRSSRSAPPARITAGRSREGLLVDDTVRCPWHHACFSLRTGEAVRPPALEPGFLLACRAAGRHGLRSREVAQPHRSRRRCRRLACRDRSSSWAAVRRPTRRRDAAPGRLCRRHHDAERRCRGALRPAQPVEGLSGRRGVRGVAPAALAGILRGSTASSCVSARAPRQSTRRDSEVQLEDGSRQPYDALLLATGAEPVRLDVPGAELPHVHYLRSLADSRAIIEAAETAQRAVRHRRELHRARSRGLAARAEARGACRRARFDPDGARPGTGDRRPRPQDPRGARRSLPPRHDGAPRSARRTSH